MWDCSNGTRLENAHASMHHKIAEMVSKLEANELSFEELEKAVEALREEFESELLKNEEEIIVFLRRNRLEIETHWQAIIDHFDSKAIYQAIYDYYARNFYSRSKNEVIEICERVTKRKFDIIV
jgi:hypothetical protein